MNASRAKPVTALLVALVAGTVAAGCAIFNTTISGNPGDCMRSAYDTYAPMRKSTEERAALGRPTRASPHTFATAFRDGARAACAILAVGVEKANAEMAAGRLAPDQAPSVVTKWVHVANVAAVRAAAPHASNYAEMQAAAEWMIAGSVKFVPATGAAMRDEASGWAAVRVEAEIKNALLPLSDYLKTARGIPLTGY